MPAVRQRVVLTRRGRIVVYAFATMLILAVAALIGVCAASAAQASRGGPPPVAVYRNMTRVVVRPGDTLWSIAFRVQPTADPRMVIPQIIDSNALRGTALQPGERLWVPRN